MTFSMKMITLLLVLCATAPGCEIIAGNSQPSCCSMAQDSSERKMNSDESLRYRLAGSRSQGGGEDPADKAAWMKMLEGDEARKKGRPDRALECYLEAGQREGIGQSLILTKQASVHVDLGMPKKALDLYREVDASSTSKNKSRLHAAMAYLALETGGEESLQKVVSLTIKILPRNKADLKRKNDLLRKLGARPEPFDLSYVDDPEIEMQNFSDIAYVWLVYGKAFHEMGNTEGVDLAYERTMQATDFAAGPSLLFVHFAMSEKDYPKAKARLDAIKELKEKEYIARYKNFRKIVDSAVQQIDKEHLLHFAAKGRMEMERARLASKINYGL